MDSENDSPSTGSSARDRLARNVRRARLHRQLSIIQLAQESGLPRERLEAIESGTLDPSAIDVADLEDLAKALHLQESDLFRKIS